jgi:YHS domain-containing protein
LALDGYCPVTVTDKMVWKRGDIRYGAIHRDRTYLFASTEEQKRFLAEPDKYSPIFSGNDPVIFLEQTARTPGKREYGLMYKNHMFLFASKESYDKFCSDSKRYAGEAIQAMQAGDVKRR